MYKRQVDALIATNPEDPYFLELEGQVLLESGRPKEAIPPLRKAVANSKSQPLIASTPVSYTHLDVYKRQTKRISKKRKKKPNAPRAANAVSYTHLDVYKRQTAAALHGRRRPFCLARCGAPGVIIMTTRLSLIHI